MLVSWCYVWIWVGDFGRLMRMIYVDGLDDLHNGSVSRMSIWRWRANKNLPILIKLLTTYTLSVHWSRERASGDSAGQKDNAINWTSKSSGGGGREVCVPRSATSLMMFNHHGYMPIRAGIKASIHLRLKTSESRSWYVQLRVLQVSSSFTLSGLSLQRHMSWRSGMPWFSRSVVRITMLLVFMVNGGGAWRETKEGAKILIKSFVGITIFFMPVVASEGDLMQVTKHTLN